MDITKIRLQNLELVLDKHFHGRKVDLANAIGVSPNNISRYYSANPDHRRSISDETARALENALGLGYGWMDVAHGLAEAQSAPVQTIRDESRFDVIKTLTREIDGLTDSEVAEVSAQLRLQLELIRRRRGEHS